MLRLVGGTEFKRADGAESAKTEVVEAAPTTKKKAVKVPAALSPAEKDAARKLIFNFVVQGRTPGSEKSVRDWLDTANQALETGGDGSKSQVKLYFDAFWALDRLGIALSSGGKFFGTQDDAFATVIEPKKLARYIPQLKKGAADLLGLPLY